jgi:hypothetical protein
MSNTNERTEAHVVSHEGQPDTAVIGVFATHTHAEETVKELQKSGFDMRRLSIVGKGYHSEEHPVGFYTTGDRMKAWGGIGAFWGGVWGLLIGGAFFWIPGVGPLAAAGPFVHMLVSGVEGAVMIGGLGAVGAALTRLGVPKESVLKYERHLRANKYLLIAHGSPEEVQRAHRILQQRAATEAEIVTVPTENVSGHVQAPERK